MEYKKNKKKFTLDFKKKVTEAAVSNKRKLAEDVPADVHNAKKGSGPNHLSNWLQTKTVREMFPDMKDEKCDLPDYKSYIKFVGRCEELLIKGKFEIESNTVANKFRIVGAGALKKCTSVRKELFEFFVDIRSSLKARLLKKIFLAKAKSLYQDYCEWKREEGEEP